MVQPIQLSTPIPNTSQLSKCSGFNKRFEAQDEHLQEQVISLYLQDIICLLPHDTYPPQNVTTLLCLLPLLTPRFLAHCFPFPYSFAMWFLVFLLFFLQRPRLVPHCNHMSLALVWPMNLHLFHHTSTLRFSTDARWSSYVIFIWSCYLILRIILKPLLW